MRRRSFLGAMAAVVAAPVAALRAARHDARPRRVRPGAPETVLIPNPCPGCNEFLDGSGRVGSIKTDCESLHCTGCGHTLAPVSARGRIVFAPYAGGAA